MADLSSSFPSIIDATSMASSSSPKNLTKPSPIPSSHSNFCSFPRLSLHWTSMADPSSSHNKSQRALSLTLNPSSVSLSSQPELSLNPCSLISKSLSNELHGRPSQAHPLTAIGFIFLRSCFMGFIFLWFWLWVHLISFILTSVSVSASISAVWSRSRKRVGSGLERMELDLGLRLD